MNDSEPSLKGVTVMARKYQYFYYRIYDDKEQFNYIKSGFTERKIYSMLKRYERKHQEYRNEDFLDFLKQYDPRAEIITVFNISY